MAEQAVMTGRDGAERYPQASEASLEVAVLRALRALDPSITIGWVQDAIPPLAEEETVLRARNAVVQHRPADVRAFFKAQFRGVVAPRTSAPRPAATPLKPLPDDDPYGF
jgi:hypothetical protein